MRLKPFSTKHKILLVLATAGIAALAAHAIWGQYGLLHLRYLEGQQELLEQRLFRLHLENERLRSHLDRMETDDSYLDQVVRERLGLVAPNEVLIEFATPTPTTTAGP
ncbi:MAG: hypothetical protein KatS3mg077_1734 [Candidatus Binatia bacterium]|nr:MAG: hypothetical protein KatS3mg077_1734 [Candidatus Binatia bacterium]